MIDNSETLFTQMLGQDGFKINAGVVRSNMDGLHNNSFKGEGRLTGCAGQPARTS